MPKQNDTRLTIVDPNNPDNDISGGSREIGAILETFRHAHAALQTQMSKMSSGESNEQSILGCIWGGNYDSFIRQRQKLSMLERGYASSPSHSPVVTTSTGAIRQMQGKPAQKPTTNDPERKAAKKSKRREAREAREANNPTAGNGKGGRGRRNRR
jgi:non-canonical poly(A) RNA polymerase PAPD5/7